MIKRVIIVVLMFTTTLAHAQKKEVLKRFTTYVFFDTDKYIIKPNQQQKLNNLADTLLKYDDYVIRMYGHTDSVGSKEYNQTLSKNRQEAVKSYLTSKGINGDSMKYGYFGETRPKVPNSNDVNMARNRRVEIVVTILKTIEPPVTEPDTLVEIVDEGCPEGDTTIILSSGTQIVVPGCAFGEYKRSEICMEFQESTTPESFDQHGLNTVTEDGEVLVSYGMFKLKATVCETGEELKDLNKAIQVQFPYNLDWENRRNSCVPTNIGIYTQENNGWRRRNSREMTTSVVKGVAQGIGTIAASAINVPSFFVAVTISTLSAGWVNCDAPLYVSVSKGKGGQNPNSTQSFKIRDYKLDKLYLTYTFAEGINTRIDFDVYRGGVKARARVFCQSCGLIPTVKVWAWAHDDDGNKYVIKGKDIKDLKARKTFKRCQTDFLGIIPRMLYLKIRGTTARKFILKPTDFEKDDGVEEPKPEPTIIQFS